MSRFILTATLSMLAAQLLLAQQVPGNGGQTGVPLPRGQAPDLNRQTTAKDETPLFNLQKYFIDISSRWKFSWDVPESPIGPGGTFEGTTTYRALGDGGVDERFYEARTEGMGPEGPVTQVEVISYDRARKSIARTVTDSRGFSFLQTGTIGGDLGGYYNIHLEGSPFEYRKHKVRVRTSLILFSPVRYRVQTTISVDGGRFVNYGQDVWWEKELPPSIPK